MIQDADVQSFKELLLKKVKKEAEKHPDFAILFSGGVDSCMVLFACLELGLKPKCYTFGLEGVLSKDVETSRAICERFGVELEVVTIPNDVEQLEADVRFLIRRFGKLKKTSVQCLHPYLYIMPKVKEKAVFLGLGGDNLFVVGRRAKLCRDDKEKYDEIRREMLASITDELSRQLVEEDYHISFIDIFNDADIFNFALKFDWREMNTPKEKYIAYASFKDYFDASEQFFRKHSAYQINSGLREHHDLLLQQPHLNRKGHKAVIGIYNQIYKEEHSVKQLSLFDMRGWDKNE